MTTDRPLYVMALLALAFTLAAALYGCGASLGDVLGAVRTATCVGCQKMREAGLCGAAPDAGTP